MAAPRRNSSESAQFLFGRVFLAQPALRGPVRSSLEGEVDNINPAIETILSIFGQSDGAPQLTFHLVLGFDIIPGVILVTEREDVDMDHFSIDLPNLIEKWRVEYASDARCKPVEVRPEAESYRDPFTEKRGLVEEQRWEILEEGEAERLRVIQIAPNKYAPYPTMRFSLRRKELSGPLVAADPNPYSWRRDVRAVDGTAVHSWQTRWG